MCGHISTDDINEVQVIPLLLSDKRNHMVKNTLSVSVMLTSDKHIENST